MHAFPTSLLWSEIAQSIQVNVRFPNSVETPCGPRAQSLASTHDLTSRTLTQRSGQRGSMRTPLDTHTIAEMLFQIDFSFFFSISLGNDAISEPHRPVGVQDQDQGHVIPPRVPQQTIEPGLMIKEPVAASAPVRPVLSRFAPCFRAESATQSERKSGADADHTADTHLTKASDRGSLEVLLRSVSQHENPVRAAASNVNTRDELSDSSLVQHSPVVSPDMLPQGPIVVRQSPVLEDDSGSDLVSSLQRIRVGGLACYFEEVERRARARTLALTTTRVSGGHDQGLSIEVEADRSTWAYSVADGEWSEVTVREANGEE